MTDLPEYDDYEPRRGEEFLLRLDTGDAIPLELYEVVALGDGAPRPGLKRQQPFSLVFLGPPGFVTHQQIWPLEHEQLGEVRMFLVPVGPTPEGRMRFEAIFN